MLDTEGPATNTVSVCYKANDDCTISNTGEVEVVVNFVDPGAIYSADLNGYDPVETNGSEHTFLLDVSDTYKFIAEDEHGWGVFTSD